MQHNIQSGNQVYVSLHSVRKTSLYILTLSQEIKSACILTLSSPVKSVCITTLNEEIKCMYPYTESGNQVLVALHLVSK